MAINNPGAMNTPVIILVQPQLGENIGAAARAMMNFGLRELRLVAPRDGWPNPKAYDTATHAAAVLDNVKLYDSTQEAIADMQHVYATTARGRDMVKPSLAPETLLQRCREKSNERAAILFGPERTGLTNEDITLCEAIVTIPTQGEYASLNIAQSVVILAYEWCKAINAPAAVMPTTAANASPVNEENLSPPATREELQGFFDQLEDALHTVDFFKTPEKKPRMWENLRNIFTRTQLTEQEVRTLRGVVRGLQEGKRS